MSSPIDISSSNFHHDDADADADADADTDAVAVAVVVPSSTASAVGHGAATTSTSTVTSTSKSKSSSNKLLSRSELLLQEVCPQISDREYENMESLMTQFCRVPLLAEFRRPVSLLHEELNPIYTKIIKHPVDVGYVCRGIRKRHYNCTRDVRLDMWRVFNNCVKFHTDPRYKGEASFVSIALHLNDFFNHLWQEYMLPSDYRRTSVSSFSNSPDATSSDLETYEKLRRTAFAQRDMDRQKRLNNSGVLVLSKPFTIKKVQLLDTFIRTGGCVDVLDTEPIFGLSSDNIDQRTIKQNLRRYQNQLQVISQSPDREYTLDEFYRDLKYCYTSAGNNTDNNDGNDEILFENNKFLKDRVRNRFERFFWKQAVPLHEANSRGVGQSSIWGNIAATIWARESSKQPYWPALCLGILAPPEQREGWHDAITERNEDRLPEKLRTALSVTKNKCEIAQQKQSLSYFLVEFLGTHTFFWVRETDIIENFDPKDDPNTKNSKTSSKKGRSIVNTQKYQTALQECLWAFEEYESVLQDAFEVNDTATIQPTSAAIPGVEDANGEVSNYSYAMLGQSDDEADQEPSRSGTMYQYDEDDMSVSDADEAEFLIANNGKLDTTASGRKDAKLRSMAKKKKIKGAANDNKKDESSQKRKSVSSSSNSTKDKRGTTTTIKKENRESTSSFTSTLTTKIDKERAREKEREEKKEVKDIEKRRKKRERDRERMIRMEEKKGKFIMSSSTNSGKRLSMDDNDSIASSSNNSSGNTTRGGNKSSEDNLIKNKRARATAIAKAYQARFAKLDDSKSLALAGVLTMPASMVDSIGLLGLALAFRAASGELSMPDDDDEQILKNSQPWNTIDTTSTILSNIERCTNLQKQISMIEKELTRVRNETQHRNQLTQQHIISFEKKQKQILTNDKAARENHYKQRKKPLPRSSLSSSVHSHSGNNNNSIITGSGGGGTPSGSMNMEDIVVDDGDDDNDDDDDNNSSPNTTSNTNNSNKKRPRTTSTGSSSSTASPASQSPKRSKSNTTNNSPTILVNADP